MNARFYDRLAAMASIVFLLVLAAGTYYLAVWVSRDQDTTLTTTSNEPDVFVEGVSLTRVNTMGDPVFQMSASSMLHYPIDGSSEFRMPTLVSLAEDRPRMTLRANVATASREGQSTVLEGNVVLERQAMPDNPTLTIETERLVLTVDDETARTDLPVLISHGTARLSGVGMEFDNLLRTLRLNDQVQADVPENAAGALADREPDKP